MNLDDLNISSATKFVFYRDTSQTITISAAQLQRVEKSHARLLQLVEEHLPIYGVTTGFGASVERSVDTQLAQDLQHNLLQYLSCGTGDLLPRPVARAAMLLRLKSLSRGYSAVSTDLVMRLKQALEEDLVPEIPREGSLGASGDLIPLAYIARSLAGEGWIQLKDGSRMEAGLVLKRLGLKPYVFKPKEALAMVNGTSAMAGHALVNTNHLRFMIDLCVIGSAWLCTSIGGKAQAFSVLVNEKAKNASGQSYVAQKIRTILQSEGYDRDGVIPQRQSVDTHLLNEALQDRYSLRCVPQILGPIYDTLDTFSAWLEAEINATSDNPLIDPDESEARPIIGGNFYGGYMSMGMDYFKICQANMADLIDRQISLLFDEKTIKVLRLNPNLANWSKLPKAQHHIHHGLKGLHQALNAVAAEIAMMAMPSSIFSRSSESHNQDKVSLGMSAATSCYDQQQKLFRAMALYLSCLGQALELRQVVPKSGASKDLYDLLRQHVPFVSKDSALGDAVSSFARALQAKAETFGRYEA